MLESHERSESEVNISRASQARKQTVVMEVVEKSFISDICQMIS